MSYCKAQLHIHIGPGYWGKYATLWCDLDESHVGRHRQTLKDGSAEADWEGDDTGAVYGDEDER